MLDQAFISDLRSASTKALRALTSVLDAALDPIAKNRPPVSQVRLAAIQVLKLAQTFLTPADSTPAADHVSPPKPESPSPASQTSAKPVPSPLPKADPLTLALGLKPLLPESLSATTPPHRRLLTGVPSPAFASTCPT